MKNLMPGYEKRKITIDLFKHFSALSVGIIALTASFLGNLSQLSNSNNTIIFAVVSFFLVIIFSSIALYILLANIEKIEYHSLSHYILRLSLFIVFLSFFSGTGAFVYLILKNI
jgi:phage shock protein PspC (stress-responsive transcriptional regulator)